MLLGPWKVREATKSALSETSTSTATGSLASRRSVAPLRAGTACNSLIVGAGSAGGLMRASAAFASRRLMPEAPLLSV
ncbi:hypothetical protein D3C86_1373910 [compost metagenome]